MTETSNAVPVGFNTVTPYLIMDDTGAAIDFYKQAFDAVETFRLMGGNGRVVHAEIQIGNSPVMLADAATEYAFMRTASQLGGSPVQMYLYLQDAERSFNRALEAGANVIMPVEVQDDGDRRGGVMDPFGIIWWIATATDPNARERLMEEQPAD